MSIGVDFPYVVAFSVFPGIGPVRFRLLHSYFGSAEKAWNASVHELQNVGIPPSLLTQFIDFRQKFKIESYLKEVAQKHIRILSCLDPEYPARLKEILDAPIALYIFGTGPFSLLGEKRMIAVVGTRNITSYGKAATWKLTRELTEKGFVIVSGLALGVDGLAHQATLSNGGRTVAVLGCGVDVIAPVSHTTLYYQIANSGGLIVSEMPLGHQPLRGLFPARNRIISGLSLGVVVTEGAEDSGALITARYAAEQGREVFAVPGPITSYYSRGPAKLLKNGAVLVETGDDVLQEFGMKGTQPKPATVFQKRQSQIQQQILRALAATPLTADAMVQTLNVNATVILTALTELELDGHITQTNDGTYILTG